MRFLGYPEGPSTQYLRPLVPNTIHGMDVGTRVHKYWVLGPSGPVDGQGKMPQKGLNKASWEQDLPDSWVDPKSSVLRLMI